MNKHAFALGFFLLSSYAFAAAEPARTTTAPIVSLSANAARTVLNDIATASLFVDKEDSDAAMVAEAITVQANKAYALFNDFPDLKVKTASHQAYPVWDKNKIIRWRVRHEISVEATDFKILSKAIGAAQPYVQLGGIQFSVSGKLRDATESQLIQEASTAFKKRADLVRQSFGASAYRIREIALQSGEPARIAPMLRTMAAPSELTPPSLEGGSNEISLTISGSVELTLP